MRFQKKYKEAESLIFNHPCMYCKHDTLCLGAVLYVFSIKASEYLHRFRMSIVWWWYLVAIIIIIIVISPVVWFPRSTHIVSDARVSKVHRLFGFPYTSVSLLYAHENRALTSNGYLNRVWIRISSHIHKCVFMLMYMFSFPFVYVCVCAARVWVPIRSRIWRWCGLIWWAGECGHTIKASAPVLLLVSQKWKDGKKKHYRGFSLIRKRMSFGSFPYRLFRNGQKFSHTDGTVLEIPQLLRAYVF